jgi:AcrR family transcriptional regulator
MSAQAAAPTKRQRTHAALLVALQELLLDPDVTTLSVPQVVGRVGVAQGTFYHHFESLPAAIDALGALLLTEHARVLRIVTAGAADSTEIVARSARQTLMMFVHRPEVGRLMFDSGLPVDRFATGLRGHFHDDLRDGIDRGDFSVADFAVASTVYTGTMLGACLDLHRGLLTAAAVPDVVGHLLRTLGVSPGSARRIISAPQEFVQWAPIPLSAVEEV